VGFSDPILSYFSALKLNLFDGGRLLKEGYEKVIYPPPNRIHVHRAKLTMFLFLDETRFIQSCHFSKVDGTGFWA